MLCTWGPDDDRPICTAIASFGQVGVTGSGWFSLSSLVYLYGSCYAVSSCHRLPFSSTGFRKFGRRIHDTRIITKSAGFKSMTDRRAQPRPQDPTINFCPSCELLFTSTTSSFFPVASHSSHLFSHSILNYHRCLRDTSTMPSTWSLLDEKKLLINIIEISGVKMPSWAVVAEKMDGGYTAEACRYVSTFSSALVLSISLDVRFMLWPLSPRGSKHLLFCVLLGPTVPYRMSPSLHLGLIHVARCQVSLSCLSTALSLFLDIKLISHPASTLKS